MNIVLRLFSVKLFGGAKYRRKVVFGIFLAIVSTASFAWDTIIGKVVYVEPSHLPETVVFAMTTGSSSCPAGKELRWSKTDDQHQNNMAAYEALMTAIAFDKNVQIFLYSGDTTCEGQYLHLLRE